MNRALRRLFGQGLFFTGWRSGLFSMLLAAAVACMSQVYNLLNHGPSVLYLHTPLDSVIPLVPVFVVPYLSLEPFIIITLILFLLLRTRYFQSACLAMLCVWLVSYLFYFFLQSRVIRPAVTGTDIFSRLVLRVYALDNPFNDFPSLHTSLSTLLTLYWFRLNRTLGRILGVWTALIVLSTLLVKQHYLPDLLFGLALGAAGAWFCMKIFALEPASSARAG
jgi:membrane-associated phospholipid phosphatase